MAIKVKVGQVWRPDLGGPHRIVVARDDRFAYIRRADEPKKNLLQPGAHTVALSEFDTWTLISEADA